MELIPLNRVFRYTCCVNLVWRSDLIRAIESVSLLLDLSCRLPSRYREGARGGDDRRPRPILTGDKSHLLKLKHTGGIPIVAASEFLRWLGTPENPA